MTQDIKVTISRENAEAQLMSFLSAHGVDAEEAKDLFEDTPSTRQKLLRAFRLGRLETVKEEGKTKLVQTLTCGTKAGTKLTYHGVRAMYRVQSGIGKADTDAFEGIYALGAAITRQPVSALYDLEDEDINVFEMVVPLFSRL
jgi:hypothetical protein